MFLGLPLGVWSKDDVPAGALCSRALAAFMANRPLLVCKQAPIQQRMSMFSKVVASTVRWVWSCLTPSRSILARFRVQQVTLVVWVLGLRVHSAWFEAQALADVRHIAKVIIRWYSGWFWDIDFLRQHFNWIGHVVRNAATPITRASILSEASLLRGSGPDMRRARRGPDNSSTRLVAKYIASQGFQLSEAASNREFWQGLQASWVAMCGLQSHTPGQRVWKVLPEVMAWDRKSMMGSCSSSRLVFVTLHAQQVVAAVFLHDEGWKLQYFPAVGDVDTFISEVVCSVGVGMPSSILHLRIFISVPGFSLQLPRTYSDWEVGGRVLVAEFSSHPDNSVGEWWRDEVKAAVEADV